MAGRSRNPLNANARTLAQTRSDLGLGVGLFKVNRNGTQQTSLTSAAYNKVNLTNEIADSNNWFDSTTNYRFTPLVAGWYHFGGSCYADSFSASESPILAVYINGSITGGLKGNYATGPTFTSYVAQVGGELHLNGSSDYVELFIYLPSGGTTIGGQIELTYFGGVLLRAD